jgi:putative methanogenesis marker protein 3
MITIHVDGERREASDGSTLGSMLPGHPEGCAVAVIRPATQQQAETKNLAISTSAGEITLELAGSTPAFLLDPALISRLALHWEDRYAASFGHFPTDIRPSRKPHLYERGEVILGCGGYDRERSYLLFAKTRHSADHGADETGGVIGRIVSGRAVLDRWATGDRIAKIEPVISWADTSRSFTTTDMSLILEEGMRVVTSVRVMAQGFTPDRITTEAAASVEHLLIALESGRFVVGRATTTHILDDRAFGTDVPAQYKHPRREGTVTVRTNGSSRGGIYIYRADVPSSPSHSIVGQVVHGIELVKLAKEGDVFIVNVQPQRIDLLGLPLDVAKQVALTRGFALNVDKAEESRIVVSQEPGTTLDVLNERAATVTTAPLTKVVDIELDDAKAPVSCDVFRRITGLKEHDAGMMPAFFTFDDVFLFKPAIPPGTPIYPENCPVNEASAAALAITNDSRKGAGLVGVRLSANKEFGPTSEPFEGTNIIGRVIDTEKLKAIKEREMVYIREVRR